MKKMLIAFVTMALASLALQAAADDVTAGDINLAKKLREQRRVCYQKLDKAPNDDYEVPESELMTCMMHSWGYAMSGSELAQAQFETLIAIQRTYAEQLIKVAQDKDLHKLTTKLLNLAQAMKESDVNHFAPELQALNEGVRKLQTLDKKDSQ